MDKCDKIGVDGVVDLLQKPPEEFGAGLNAIQAGLVGLFLGCKADNSQDAISNMESFFSRAKKVTARIELMVHLDSLPVDGGTKTAWDALIVMPVNADETWSNGRRPANLAWALDDIISVLSTAGMAA
jgi:hypothetical protein